MQAATLTTLADWLAYLRHKAQWEQVDLAAAAQVSAEAISHIERGVVQAQQGTGRGPRKGTRAALAQALADRFDALAADDDPSLLPEEAAELKAQTQYLLTAPAGPAAPRVATVPTNVPVRLTSFIGRRAEMARLAHSLRSGKTRLLTFTGPGGVGKTRLAVEAATALSALYPDGVYLVELASLAEADLVLPTVARTLGLRVDDSQSLADQLVAHLRPRKVLLVLDNLEHLLPAAPAVTSLLAECPHLSVLATSRVGLCVRGERRFPVAPLALPDGQRLPPLPLLSRYAAIALFTDRAQMSAPDFQLVEATAPIVAAICLRLDGLPLAIELTAVRLADVSLDMVAAQLAHRLEEWGARLQDLPARQQTLRSTISWSYDFLTADDQAVFRHLGVFAGGCTPAAACAVCGGDTAAIEPCLDRLVEKSLLQRTGDQTGRSRYSLLNVVREYALEELARSGEEAVTVARHLAYYTALAEASEPPSGDALLRLECEHDNIRAALGRCLAAGGDLWTGLRLAAPLWRFWQTRGYSREGRAWLADLVGRAPTGEPGPGDAERLRVLALAHDAAGRLALGHGDHAAAIAAHERSLALCHQAGDQHGAVRALNCLGNVALRQGRLAGAQEAYEHSRILAEQLGDRRASAAVVSNLAGIAAQRGDYDTALALSEEALAIHHALGDSTSPTVARIVDNLAGLSRFLGHHDRALAYHTRSLLLHRRAGDKMGCAATLHNLGDLALSVGDRRAAARRLRRSLALYEALDHAPGSAASLALLGQVALQEGEPTHAEGLFDQALRRLPATSSPEVLAACLDGMAECAFAATAAGLPGEAIQVATLCGAAQGFRARHGLPQAAGEPAAKEARRVVLAAALGEAQFSIAWEQGRVLDDAAAIAAATAWPQMAHHTER